MPLIHGWVITSTEGLALISDRFKMSVSLTEMTATSTKISIPNRTGQPLSQNPKGRAREKKGRKTNREREGSK